MPIPKKRKKEPCNAYVSRVISFLDDENPRMPHKQKVAIALNTARKAGCRIKAKKKRGR